jgi:anti-anti-sigma regulatory factor
MRRLIQLPEDVLPAEPGLKVFHSTADNTEVIECRGSLGSDRCDELQEAIDRALSRQVERLRIELKDATAVDDAVVRCLNKTAERCTASGVRLELVADRRIEQRLATGSE